MKVKIHKKLTKKIVIEGIKFNLKVTYSNDPKEPYMVEISKWNSTFGTKKHTQFVHNVPTILLEAKNTVAKQIRKRDNDIDELERTFDGL